MSFAGSTGHKSPFPERAKTAKSPLPQKRSAFGGGGGGGGGAGARVPAPRAGSSEAAIPRAAAQQSLFGKEPQPSSPAKVGQWRGAQVEVNEPTTPTKMSEGGLKDSTTFSRCRAAAPVRSIKPAFGAMPPRSPKRPYVSSPKYQKVLLERPAFYNAPTPAPAETRVDAAPKKEVSIAELQERLKKFLQEENACAQSLDIPYTISSSPRVNPLFHHDHHAPLQTAEDGGAAITAGVLERESLDLSHEEVVGVGAGAADASPDSVQEDQNESVGSQVAPLTNADPLPQSLDVAKGGVAFTAIALNEFVSKSTEVLPDPNTGAAPADAEVAVPFEAEEATEDATQEVRPSPVSSGADADEAVASSQDEDSIVDHRSSSEVAEEATEIITDAAASDEGSEAEALLGGAHEAAQAGVPLATIETEELDAEFKEETEAPPSWARRFVRSTMLTLLVACIMGAMVLASGSPGLLPQRWRANPVAKFLRASSPTTSFLPTSSIGIMAVGKEFERFPCLPSLHWRPELLPEIVDAPRFQGFADGDLDDPPSSSSAATDRDDDLDDLTNRFKDLQGRLFSDVAGLARETATSDPSTVDSKSATPTSTKTGVCAESDDNFDSFEGGSPERDLPGETCAWFQGLVPESAPKCSTAQEFQDSQETAEPEPDVKPEDLQSDEESDTPNPAVDLPEEESEPALPIDAVLVHSTEEPMAAAAAGHELYIPSAEVSASAPEVSPLEEAAHIGDDSVDTVTQIAVVNDEVPTTDLQATQESIELGSAAEVDDLLHYVDELFNAADESEPDSRFHGAAVAASKSSISEPPVWTRHSEADAVASLPAGGFPPAAILGLLAAAAAIAAPFLLKPRKNAPFANTTNATETAPQTDARFFPATEARYKPAISPVARRPAAHYSALDTRELHAISSPLSRARTPAYGAAEPATSAPAAAATWHRASPAMQEVHRSALPSSYRQTATYVPSQSVMSSTTTTMSEADSVVESALSMGADEWERLGSFTTTEVISINEGGGEHKMLTPVRRSQRLRNKAVSPLPARFSEFEY